VEKMNLVGLFEIAMIAGVRPSAVANWRRRDPDFPKPLAELRAGPVFQENDIQAWLRTKLKKPKSGK